MKTIVLIMSMLTLGLVSCSKDDDVKLTDAPEAVKSSFNSKFQGATHVELEKKGTVYEYDFKLNDVEYEAVFESNGTLVKFKHDLTFEAIPAPVKAKLETDYAGKTYDEIESVTINDVTYYQVEIDNQPNDIKLVFNADGSLNTAVPFWD